MKFCTRIVSVLGIALLGFSWQSVNAERAIIFSTAPTQSVKLTRERYQPIADYLTKAIGRKVKLVPSQNFVQYSRSVIKGDYDLIFDGPQFVSWRMARDNDTRHNVLAKLPGKLRFVVAVRRDLRVNNVRRLAGKRVCAVASPNLLTLGFLDLFPNPSSVPVMVSVKSFKKGLGCALKNNGVGVILRDKFWNKVSAKKPKIRRGLKLLYTAKVAWPHRAFSISNKIDRETQNRIKNALLSAGGTKASKKVLKQFKSKSFVPASTAEYTGHGKLLKPIWGFHEQ